MKILIITGHLAYPLVKKVLSEYDDNVLIHVADSQVAAFLTPSKIIEEVKNNYEDQLSDIDLILSIAVIQKTLVWPPVYAIIF